MDPDEAVPERGSIDAGAVESIQDSGPARVEAGPEPAPAPHGAAQVSAAQVSAAQVSAAQISAEADARAAEARAEAARLAAEATSAASRRAAEARTAAEHVRAAVERRRAILRTKINRAEVAARAVTQRRAALLAAAEQRAARQRTAVTRRFERIVAKDQARRRRRRRLLVASMIAPLLVAVGVVVGGLSVDSVPTPAELSLPESTTVYFADGVTPMARLGTEHREILAYEEMNSAVRQAIVAAEDRTFWTNPGIDLSGVLRAVWNNATGGHTQGASTITQQYARVAADLTGVTYARKAREAVLALKLDRTYSKEKILEFYLNTVPFGRGAYGIEAAAQAFFGKTARATAPAAEQVTTAEAMVLASLVKQPEPDPDDPQGSPGYDPARGGRAAANAASRWEYVRTGMVTLGYLTQAEADDLEYPHTIRALGADADANGSQRPTGLVVSHVLSELRQSEPFVGKPSDYIRNGGFRIVTTVDRRAQDAAEAAADIRRNTTPEPLRGQPANWQAALVAVQPGTGRVLAYFGGGQGTGADFAGWFYDDDGVARGYGEHPPGSTFKVYDLAEALRQHIPLQSHFDSPAVKEFPASGRTKASAAGPVSNASSAPCQPDCTLTQATIASLNVPFFDLTERLGTANVIEMARRAGIDAMWTVRPGRPDPVRIDLRESAGPDVVGQASVDTFATEVGIGQYGVTVLDHANGMATFAAGGKRARAHFVREVSQHGRRVYAESLVQSDVGLTAEQVNELTWTLSQVPSAQLGNGWDAAGKTGTWQAGASTDRNAHTWMVGYTRAIAAAVWVGTTDGSALKTKDGKYDVFGSTHAALIWRQFLVDATAALRLDPATYRFAPPPAGG